MKIYAIVDGVVLPYVLDPNFEKYLPIIPSEVSSVNFTWKSGDNHLYYYDFDQLISFNEEILSKPIVSIEQKGKVPKKPKVFQVFIPCVGNISGIASFTIGLRIINSETNEYLPGTPLRLKLQKQCADRGPDPECDKKCGNGKCNQNKICECPTGLTITQVIYL
jgi:WNT inhibitory factor 1